MSSIRGRLVLMLSSALFIAGVVAAVATYYSVRAELSALFDDQLRHAALDFVESGNVSVERLVFLGQSPRQQITLQVYDAETNQVFSSSPDRTLPLADRAGFSQFSDAGGVIWRQYAAGIGARVVQVAQPLGVRNRLAASAALRILQPLLILIFFLALCIWFAIAQSLQPLAWAARAVAQRSPASLRPLAERRLPEELRQLVGAINSLMRRLGESLEAQRRLASDAAHELRTPLTAIRLSGQLLAGARSDEDRARYGRRLSEGVDRATRLIEQLLTLARLDPEAGQKPMSEVDLAELARAVVEDCSAEADAKGVTLTTALAPVSVTGMPDALRLTLANLVENAIRYGPAGGHALITVAPDGDYARLSVADDGPGVPPEERQRVFERFYRGLGTGVTGHGLGLAIARRVATLHGAEITVGDGLARPDGGRGALFEILLPRSAAAGPLATLPENAS